MYYVIFNIKVVTLILVLVVTRGQLRFPKRLDLSIPQYNDRRTSKNVNGAENSGPQVLDNNTLENFCVDVSVFSELKFKEFKRERFYLWIFFLKIPYFGCSCETEFVKSCEERREKVCMEVTEMQCEVGQSTLQPA